MFSLVGFFLMLSHLFTLVLFLVLDRMSGILLEFFLFDFFGINVSFVFLFDWVSLGFVSFISLISASIFFMESFTWGMMCWLFVFLVC